MSKELRAFLYTPDSAAFNSGIWGGPLPQFEAFRASLEQRTRAHYAAVRRRHGRRPRFVVDMLVFNEAVLSWPGPVVTGFPEGPVNAPMFGNVCKPWNPCDADYEQTPQVSNAGSAGRLGAGKYAWEHAVRKRIRLVAENALPAARVGKNLVKKQQGTPTNVSYSTATGFGLYAYHAPHLGPQRINVTRPPTGNSRVTSNSKACVKSVLRALVPAYYFRHKLYCGNAIPC